jgi:hypothetical protein
MKEEKDWRDALAERYPSLYRDYKGDMRYTCMAWGIAVGDGWRELIEKLSADIVAVDVENRVVVDQVKEKFGGLRFYFHIETPEKVRSLRRLWFEKKMLVRGKVLTKFIDYRTLNKIEAIPHKLFPNLWDKVGKLVSKAEAASYEICEGCGAPGKLRGRGWVRTLCDDCGVEKTR